jgi:heme A synthase
MYTILLSLHSLFRWLVLLSLLYAIYRAYNGWLRKLPFNRSDNTIRHVTATIVHVQLILGLWLYVISPLTNYFLDHFNTAVHNRQLRFFGMEHIMVMLTAVIVITIGSVKAKRKLTDRQKFKTMAIWYTIGLLLILSSIPWAFSPLVSRPYIRRF